MFNYISILFLIIIINSTLSLKQFNDEQNNFSSISNLMSYFNNIFFSSDLNEINIAEIKLFIDEEINETKRKEKEIKINELRKKESILKSQLTQLIKENIKQQLAIEDENIKYVKYFELIKEKNEAELNELGIENITEFVEIKLASHS